MREENEMSKTKRRTEPYNSPRILADFATVRIGIASHTVAIVQFPSNLPQGQIMLSIDLPEEE